MPLNVDSKAKSTREAARRLTSRRRRRPAAKAASLGSSGQALGNQVGIHKLDHPSNPREVLARESRLASPVRSGNNDTSRLSNELRHAAILANS